MAARVSRVTLQVVSLERIAARGANPFLEMLGLTEARAVGGHTPRARATMQFHAPGALVDATARRETQLRLGGDRVLSMALSGTVHNLHADGWEDASYVLLSAAAPVTVTGLETFELRQSVRLIYNLGPSTVTFAEQHTGSLRDNRLGAEIALAAGGMFWALRDPQSSRWRTSAGVATPPPVLEEFGHVFMDPDDGTLEPIGFF